VAGIVSGQGPHASFFQSVDFGFETNIAYPARSIRLVPSIGSAQLPLVDQIDAEDSVLVAGRHGGPLGIKRHFDPDGLCVGIV